MKQKLIMRSIFAIIVLAQLIGCQSLLASSSKHDRDARIADAENRLEAMLEHLPIPPGSILVKRIDLSTGGQMPDCEGYEILALYGTNEMSFAEMLDFYSTKMEALGWHPRLADAKGRSFDMGEEFYVGVSDQYLVSGVGVTAVNEAKSRFRTPYLLELITSLTLPVLPECKGG